MQAGSLRSGRVGRFIDCSVKDEKRHHSAVIGKVKIMSKLAPHEKTMMPIDEATISASQFAKSILSASSAFLR